MNIETAAAEVGLIAEANGSYLLALYRRSDDKIVKIPVDPLVAWAICCAVRAPITSVALSPEQL